MFSRAIAAIRRSAALGLVALCACPPSAARDTSPSAVVVRVLENHGKNCREVWPLLSADTQARFRSAANRRERDRDGFPRPVDPEQEGCSAAAWGEFKRDSARVVRQQGDDAVVTVDIVTRLPRYRHDLFPPAKVVPQEFRLVRESGAWRLVLSPPPSVERGPAWRPKEIGPVDVMMPERFNPGLIDKYEATAVVRASREALVPALQDPQRWAIVLPGVKAVQPAPPAGDAPRVLLRFDEADRTLPARLWPNAKPGTPRGDNSWVTWQAEETRESPVHFRGSWTLKAHEDGSTRITLVFYIDVKQWPGDSARRIFSAERIAQAVLDLEKAGR